MGNESRSAAGIRVLRSFFKVESLSEYLQSYYNLDNVHCQLVKGTIRDTYSVQSSQGSYILSIYPHQHREKDEILAEIAFLDHLLSQQIKVPAAVLDQSGEAVIEIEAPEGTRYAVLFTYLEGRQLSKSPDPEIARRLGSFLAQFHQTADRIPATLHRPEIDFNLLVDQALSAFVAVVHHRPAIIAYLHQTAESLQPWFESFSKQAPQFGLVHGDVIPSNLLVTPNGELAVVDFDFCGYGQRFYDVATFLNEAEYWNMGDRVMAGFLEGYQQVRTLANEEISSLPYLKAAQSIFSLGIPAQNVNTWGSAYQNDRMIDKKIQNIRGNMLAIERNS